MNNEEAALLEAVMNDPEDIDQRLIAADWYEDQGDPRAEFIRIQLALFRLPRQHEWRTELQHREASLWLAHSKRWNRDAHRLLNASPLKNAFAARRSDWRRWRYRRGFIEHLDVAACTWKHSGHLLLQLGPITSLRLRNLTPQHVAPALTGEVAHRIRNLQLEYTRFDERAFATLLARLDECKNLSILNLSGGRLSRPQLNQLLEWKTALRLKEFVMSRMTFPDSEARHELLTALGSRLHHENGDRWLTARGNPDTDEPRVLSYDDNVNYEDGQMYNTLGELHSSEATHAPTPDELNPWEEGNRNDEEEHWSDYVDDDWVS